MAEGGDVATTVTTAGDLLYRDGSGLQRLAKGTASQVLTMNGGATAPSWDDAGGGTILQMKVKQDGTRRNITTVATGSGWVHTTGYDWAELSNTITLASTSSRIWVVGSLGVRAYSSYSAHYWVTYNHSGITETAIQGDDALYHGCTGKFETTDSTSDGGPNQAVSVLIAPATTNEITIKIRLSCTSASYPIGMHQTVSGSTNDTDGGNWMSNLTVMEIGNITPTLTETEIDTA
jgi:hypothetical protein